MAQVNVRVDKVANEKRIPFEVAVDPFYDYESRPKCTRARTYRRIMKKIWHDEAWETYVFWQNQDKKKLKRVSLYGKA